MLEEVIKYLVEHLEIEVDTETDFGPVEKVRVKLKFGKNIISQDYCELPKQET